MCLIKAIESYPFEQPFKSWAFLPSAPSRPDSTLSVPNLKGTTTYVLCLGHEVRDEICNSVFCGFWDGWQRQQLKSSANPTNTDPSFVGT